MAGPARAVASGRRADRGVATAAGRWPPRHAVGLARPDRGTGMKAMLLAAGLGTRMRPLTEGTAKPLLPLGGRSLLDQALDRLRDAGVDEVVVNAFWHADHIAAHLAVRSGGPRTIVRREDALLDTGGSVAAA